MAVKADIQDLVDNPRETQAIELKDWLDLIDNEQRAKLARHIAALANHGGGHIVFGFDDRTLLPNSPPEDGPRYTQDAFASIAKKYLEPAPAVELFWADRGQHEYPVLRIPSHGASPICAKAGGPQNSRGEPQGVRQYTYYIRTERPASEPITTADQWQRLIHRCVLAEHDQLIEEFGQILRGTVPTEGSEYTLADWHSAAGAWYVDRAKHFDTTFAHAAQLVPNHYQFSYRIRHQGSALGIAELRDSVMIAVVHEVHDVVHTGWSMFYPFTGSARSMYVSIVQIAGEETPVLEFDRTEEDSAHPDAWRISPDGWVTLFRGYREDIGHQSQVDQGLLPSEYLSPFLLIREVTEFLTHARAFARRFEEPIAIDFMMSWHGLSGRRLDDVMIDRDRYIAKADERNARGSWTVDQLQAQMPEAVADIANQVLVLFGGFEVNLPWLEHVWPRFR